MPETISTVNILPSPFDWVTIPSTANNPSFSIAKYPVTNAHFAKFIEAGGYDNQNWWTTFGWKAREKDYILHHDSGWTPSGDGPWTEPHPYTWKTDRWNGADQPVMGISWYEAVAFCLWLSDITDEKIMLPTANQWQYAAQGDDGRAYPWGNNWDCKRCNNSVSPCTSNISTPVTQYEGTDSHPLGESPFGVVDMAGNVAEMTLTDYTDNSNDLESYTDKGLVANLKSERVTCNSAWNIFPSPDKYRVDYRSRTMVSRRHGLGLGFRISRIDAEEQ